MEPLAAKVRPQTLDEVVGQEHLIGLGRPLRVAIEKKHLFSFILWGPPGSGKTTLARIYARALDAELHELSAVSAGKEDIRKIVEEKRGGLLASRPRVLFLDEIHRFNKAQQDFLLPYVESGELTLIGATTENPSFEVISALLSRARVFVLNPLSEKDLEEIIHRAAPDIKKDAVAWLIGYANGDARKALGIIEGSLSLYGKVDEESLAKALESPHLRYDKKGEEHYDTISAFIKSMRASQPDAALYYLARMVEAGEDPVFIARRMVVFASEDIGLADPVGLQVANDVFRASETIGYPECATNLAHGAAYLALAKKSRESYDAYFEAVADVKAHGNLPIPMKVRNAPTKLMKELGYHKGYTLYDKEPYLPDKLKKKKYLKDEK
ncbi:MAG TPA: replication-associated recombination protein A [Candidatus Paceibacterota bacterium]|nr:replication-associated recombination protein A [Candidatus Paceibacterota bacterium]